jgi:amino acid transporter
MRYPSSGGLITYLVKGFGAGRLVGIASWLGYIAAIVIVTAIGLLASGPLGSIISDLQASLADTALPE